MKSIPTLLIACVLAMINPVEASEFSEDELAVRERAMDYFWGRQNGDQVRLERAFDTENGYMKWVVPGEDGDQLRTMALSDFRDRLSSPLANDTEGKLLTMDIVDGIMAFVKLRLVSGTTEYTDYLLMFKRDGNWEIINKMFVVGNSEFSDFSSDETSIRERVRDYFVGRAAPDQDRLRRAFDSETAKLYWVGESDGRDRLFIRDVSDYIAGSTEPETIRSSGRIHSLDVVDGRMAWVKFNLKSRTSDVMEYILMFKRDGNWQIINKMFVMR